MKDKSKPFLSEEDLIKLKRNSKSPEFDKVIEKFNEDARNWKSKEEDKRYCILSGIIDFKDFSDEQIEQYKLFCKQKYEEMKSKGLKPKQSDFYGS